MSLPLLLVDDVAGSFAAIVTARLASASAGERVRLGCSGGVTGRACAEALARAPVDLSRLEIFVADERCVDPGAKEANETTLKEALGARLGEIAAFHPMRCSDGAAAYETILEAAGPLDVLQLGVGPDGHTASLFPGSPALEAAPGHLVVESEDPSGRNPFARLTLTFEAITASRLVVVTVAGAEKRGILARLAEGEDLPAQRLRAGRIIWLVDAPALGELAADQASVEELARIGRRRP